MRLATVSIATVLLFATTARAHLAVEPIREVLRGASTGVRACAVAHALPAGRYSVRIVVGTTGAVTNVELQESPAPLSAPAASCLTTAFARLVFPAMGAPPPSPTHVRVHGRYARVPAGPGRHEVGNVTIVWPFVITPG